MTDREKAIVMAHTGIAMLVGDKFTIFHEYIESLLERPIYTHELACEEVWNEIKEKSKNDFLKICADTEKSQGEWIKCQNNMFRCSICGQADEVPTAMGTPIYNYCPNCGADMRGGAE